MNENEIKIDNPLHENCSGTILLSSHDDGTGYSYCARCGAVVECDHYGILHLHRHHGIDDTTHGYIVYCGRCGQEVRWDTTGCPGGDYHPPSEGEVIERFGVLACPHCDHATRVVAV